VNAADNPVDRQTQEKTMRDSVKTIGNLIDKATVSIISSVDKAGFPNSKAMLRGTMEVLQDKESKAMIWKDGDEMYYPGGVTDPDYCVLKFIAQNGRYYRNFKSENFEVD
jgi:general stress protein 26